MTNLPTLPQTPTDNLYKFMSIFGLTLLIVGYVIPIYYTYTEMMNQKEVMARIRVLDTNMAISGAFEGLKAMTEDKEWTPEEKEKIRAQLNTFQEKNGQTIDELEKLTTRQSFSDIVFTTAKIMAWSGTFLIIFGFFLWYFKLQKYQDAIIKNQAELGTKELAEYTKVAKPKRRRGLKV